MIVKILDAGPDPGGLVRYAFGPGEANEHERQRTVAGSCMAVAADGITSEALDQVADDLRLYQRTWGTDVIGGHVQHITIALNPGDAPISDAQWQVICEDYMRSLGWTDPAKADARWTAVNHGLNEAGADHVHIIASRVRADGTQVNVYQHKNKSQRWAAGAEKRYGLIVLDSRTAGIGGKGLTKGEYAKAKDTGREPDRLQLERAVRRCALQSSTEVDYIQALRAAGLDPRPRIDKATGNVTGYSVGRDGERRYGGGSLAPDLALPALRRVAWPDRNPAAAAQQWAHPTAPRTTTTTPTSDDIRTLTARLNDDMKRAAKMTPSEHRAWSAEAAALAAAAAQHSTDPDMRTRLQTLARDLGRWAGNPTRQGTKHAGRSATGKLAGVLAKLGGHGGSGDRDSDEDRSGALADVATAVVQIANAHQSSRPVIAAQVAVERHAEAQQIAIAKASTEPGYYRTEDGSVVRVRRARAGHSYAVVKDTETGQWRPGRRDTITAAARGTRMNITEVAAWEKSQGVSAKTAPAGTAPSTTEAQRANRDRLRTTPRRQPNHRRGRA